MSAPDYDSNDNDSDNDGSSSSNKVLQGIDKIYKAERRSRLGNVGSILSISAAGCVNSILVIVPDNKWATWVTELKEEGKKPPFHQVYVHDKAFAYRITKLSLRDDYDRFGVFKKSKIVLTSYALLGAEYQTVWHNRHESGTSDFFRKHWGLVVLQNREQIPQISNIAKAACMIMTKTGGQRFVIWGDDHWIGKTTKVAKFGDLKGVDSQKRKRITKIENGVISKKKKLDERKAVADDQANHEGSSDEEDHYPDDDEEVASPKQELAGEFIEPAEIVPKPRRRMNGKS